MTALLSRYAESLFWLARYMERVESLARILDVTDTFMRSGEHGSSWLSVVQINADEQRFFAVHAEPSADAVLHFYLRDRTNPTSAISSLAAARENARALRPLISSEMWEQVNVFHNRAMALPPDATEGANTSRLCAFLKESCQTHAGITEGTFYRDQGWVFYCLGKFIERADQTTRLLDIKYHTLLPSPRDVGGPLDASQWHALLRAASGYHAFRRLYPSTLTPATVAGFLLLNHSFPRSVVLCMRQVETYLAQLRSGFGLRHADDALERLEELRAVLMDQSIEQIIGRGLHEFCDWVQLRLLGLHGAIADAFWASPGPAAGATQSQWQAGPVGDAAPMHPAPP